MRVNNHNKTQFYLDVFNRISHYNHLLEAVAPKPKKQDNIKAPNLSRFDTKLYHSIEQERRHNNSVILKKLVAIHKKKPTGISDRYDKSKEKDTEVSKSVAYRSIEVNKERDRLNDMLYRKIVKVKPIIGSKEEWNEHYDRFVQNEKKLSKLTPDLTNIDNRFYETYTDLYSRGSKRRISLQSQRTTRLKPNTANSILPEKDKSLDPTDLLEENTLTLGLEAHEKVITKPRRKKRSKKNKKLTGDIAPSSGFVFTRDEEAEEYNRLLREYQH